MKDTAGPQMTKRHAASSDFAEFYRIRRLLGMAFAALVAVVVVGVIGFMIIGGGEYGIIDAIYMTIISLTTVGFGEIINMSGNPAGRIFTIFLVLGGMGIVAYSMLMLAAFVIEGQLRHIFARRQMQRRIERMTDHYIVCGDTAATWYVTEELIKTGRSAVIVAPTKVALDEAYERLGGLPGLEGDSSDDKVLLGAGLERAAGIIFCMENDKDNLLGVLTAHRLAPKIRIIAGTELHESKTKLLAAGADSVVSPSRIGGLRMASELIRPKVVSFLDQMLRAVGGSLRVEEVTVPENVVVADRTLGSLKVDEVEGAVLLAICRAGQEGFEFKPDPATKVESGMTLIVMAEADGRKLLEERFQAL